MDSPGLFHYIEKLIEEPDDVTMHVCQQRAGVSEDQMKWVIHQLFLVLSLVCVGDALSHVRSVKDDLQLRRVLVLVSSDARVALTVCPTTAGVGRSSFQSWTSNERQGRLQLQSWEAWTKDYDESTGTTAPDVAEVHATKHVLPAELQHDVQRLRSQTQNCKQGAKHMLWIWC